MNCQEHATPDSKRLLVLGVGWARTGTKTLQATLNSLGFGPTWHGFEFIKNNKRIMNWIINNESKIIESLLNETNDQSKTKNINWNECFEGYNSACDSLCYMFWKQIVQFYDHDIDNTNCKIILTKRDPKKWIKSVQSTINKYNYPKWYDFVAIMAKIVSPTVRKFLQSQLRLRSIGCYYNTKLYMDQNYSYNYDYNYNCNDDDCNYKLTQLLLPDATTYPELYIDLYNKHNNDVIKYFENNYKYSNSDSSQSHVQLQEWKKKLFIIDWERDDQTQMFKQFCQFLEIDKKTVEKHLNKYKNSNGFIRMNSSQAFNQMISQKLRQRLKLDYVVCLLIVLFVSYVYLIVDL